MSTKIFVPQNNGEGGIGTSAKRWGRGNFINLRKGGKDVATVDEVINAAPKIYSIPNRFSAEHSGWKNGDIINQLGDSMKMDITFQDVSSDATIIGYSITCVPIIITDSDITISAYYGGNSVEITFYQNEAEYFADASMVASRIAASLYLATSGSYSLNGNIITLITSYEIGVLGGISSCVAISSFIDFSLFGTELLGDNGDPYYNLTANLKYNVQPSQTGGLIASDFCNLINSSNSFSSLEISASAVNNIVTLVGKVGRSYLINNFTSYASDVVPINYTFYNGDPSLLTRVFLVIDSSNLSNEAGYVQSSYAK